VCCVAYSMRHNVSCCYIYALLIILTHGLGSLVDGTSSLKIVWPNYQCREHQGPGKKFPVSCRIPQADRRYDTIYYMRLSMRDYANVYLSGSDYTRTLDHIISLVYMPLSRHFYPQYRECMHCIVAPAGIKPMTLGCSHHAFTKGIQTDIF
jgi:hypothetical protein